MKARFALIMIIVSMGLSAQSTFIRTYGNPSAQEEALDFVITRDSSYVIAGMRDDDICLLKLSFQGDSLWSQTYGDSSSESVYSVVETQDSGFIVAFERSTENGLRLMGISAAGDSLWSRFFPAFSGWFKITACADGNYACAAMLGDDQLIVFKIDEFGNTVWMKGLECGSTGMGFEAGFDITADADSGLTVAYLNTGIILTKFSASGDSLWYREYDKELIVYPGMTTAIPSAIPFDLNSAENGGYVIGGMKTSLSAQMQPLIQGRIIRTDAAGDTLWTQTVSGGDFEGVIQIIPTFDGGFAGLTLGGSLFKLDAAGTGLWDREMFAYALKETSEGGLAILQEGNGDFVFAVTDSLGEIEQNAVQPRHDLIPESFCLLPNYPNPFNAATCLRFSVPAPGIVSCAVFDLSGKEVDKFHIPALSEEVSYRYRNSGLSSGVYILMAEYGGLYDFIRLVNLK